MGTDVLVITDLEFYKSVVSSKTNQLPRAFITKTGLMPVCG